ncbi:MAG: phasin family protein [Candidatus Eremiobacteraeota bacterium]|nr:phasin family protein [Candidatus Eremiobacteraeota bacterium]
MSQSDANDPFSIWRRAAQLQEEQLSALFERAAGSDAFGEALHKALENYLSATQISRENVERYLSAANLPTRADVARLAERIDGLTSRIDELAQQLKSK